MLKARIFLFLSVWIIILPYLGFPYSWKNFLFTISGLGLVVFSYIFYKEYKTKENKDKSFDSYSENSNFSEKEIS